MAYPPNDPRLQKSDTPNPDIQDIGDPESEGGMGNDDDPDNASADQPEKKHEVPQEIDPEEATELTDEEKGLIRDVINASKREDRDVRDRQLFLWRKLENYWHNILNIFWDATNQDWRVPDWDELDGELPPRLINIYRPHGEAIVAALSIRTPEVIFYPDDAEIPDDIITAKAYSDIATLIGKHNKKDLLFIRLICVLFNQGTAFAYNYHHKDKSFGTIPVPHVENVQASYHTANCQQCGSPMDAHMEAPTPEQHAGIQECPDCGMQAPPEYNQETSSFPQIVGYDETPKGRECIDIFGGLHIKVPISARKQEECGYLILGFEQQTSMLRGEFPEIASKINSSHSADFEEMNRVATAYTGADPDNVTSVTCAWIRPWHLWIAGAADKQKEIILGLQTKYPDGMYVIQLGNDLIAEVYNEKMDDHWTIYSNPMSAFIYGPPLGENLATVQDIRSELVELEIETVEHGIPERFADPDVLDFKAYSTQVSRPGMITQIKPKGGKAIADSFFETRTATLSQEVDPLAKRMDTDAQFVSAAVPSIYGGTSTSGSKTAAEYRESRAAALQRLGTTWKMLCHFWADIMSKAVIEFAEEMQEDEKDVQKTNGSFVNVWITQASLQGKVGKCEPEVSDQLPVGWELLKDTITELFGMKDPAISAVLMHPRNADLVKKAVGVTDMYIPGSDDRDKQYYEFVALSQGQPNPDGTSSVPTDPDMDDANVHMQVLKSILVGQRGIWLKESNPAAYANCVAHYKMHEMDEQANMMKQSGGAPPGEPPASAAPPLGH